MVDCLALTLKREKKRIKWLQKYIGKGNCQHFHICEYTDIKPFLCHWWPVADSGFPWGGGTNPRQHTILPNFPKNCAPLRSASGFTQPFLRNDTNENRTECWSLSETFYFLLWIIVHVKLFAQFMVNHLTAWHDVLCNLPHKLGIVRDDKLAVFLFYHQILRCVGMHLVDE